MKKLTLIFTAIIILILSACAPSQNKEGESFFAMDTYMQAEVYGDRQTVNDIKAEIESLDKKLSSVNPESEIYKLNKSGGLELDGESAELIKRSVELCGFTDGNLDITVYPVVEKWGFIDKNYKIPTQSELDSLLKNVDYKKITVNGDTAVVPNGMKLDLGAVAKGYAADKSREILSKSGVKSAILNLGGTVLAYGKKPNGENWKVGITDPENNENYMGVLECVDKTVVTSGNYERYFESGGKRYCHIINPKTGYPADNGVTSVTVISPDGTKNDALSTALFVMGAQNASEFIKNKCGDMDFIILTADKKAYITKGIEESFSLKNSEYEITVVK